MILKNVTVTLLVSLLLPSVFVVGVLGFWAGDRAPPTRVISVELLTPKVEPGGALRMRWRVQRDRACETHVDRVMFDADRNRHILPDIDINAPLGPLGEDVYSTTVDVPYFFVHGPARYVTTTTFVCNPLHRLLPVTAGVREVAFEVDP